MLLAELVRIRVWRTRPSRELLLIGGAPSEFCREWVKSSFDASAGRNNNWHKRIHDLRLHVRGARGLCPAWRLSIEDVVHMVGRPTIGKTTLLAVLAVWATGRPLHDYTMALVSGDVLSVLNLVGVT
ncbi:hypothetical protein QQY66_48655 [Streptomyces sp. DG2A-72]|uniref:hypothetical protein n=1 Tax=Streptomyces sp. DG2A-72 TaxID=3051386 RepID=UPI00265C7D88|nr:hypothetical protein [Streptomyces sp. DG2A-72]MDO0939190.1 hypothetical protein [Streptomyces sp. DG2A-72]